MYSTIASVRSHPDAINPVRAIYQKRSLEGLNKFCNIKIEAISPRPYAPPFGPYSEFRNIPNIEEFRGYLVHHPRFLYLFPRKLFMTNINSNSFRKTVTKYANNNFVVPDIVHAGHIFLDGYGMMPYCEEHNVPLCVMGRGDTLVNYSSRPSNYQKKIKEILNFSSAIICVSQDLADIASSIVDSPEKVHVVPNGVNFDLFPNDERKTIRDDLNIKSNETLVLFCGEYKKHKGIEDILELLDGLNRPNTHFIFVGQKDDLRKELEEAVKKSNIGDKSRVLFQVDPPKLARLFVAADIFLLPSYPGEGRPNVIYEAMASKTAVLSTTVGGIPEQVVDNETGILLEPGNVSSLEHNLDYLIEETSEREKMGKEGHKRLHELGLTWENHAQKVSGIHKQAIDNNNIS